VEQEADEETKTFRTIRDYHVEYTIGKDGHDLDLQDRGRSLWGAGREEQFANFPQKIITPSSNHFTKMWL